MRMYGHAQRPNFEIPYTKVVSLESYYRDIVDQLTNEVISLQAAAPVTIDVAQPSMGDDGLGVDVAVC